MIFKTRSRIVSDKMWKWAVALRKMIQDIVGINHSSILYLVYVLLSATAPFCVLSKAVHMRKRGRQIIWK